MSKLSTLSSINCLAVASGGGHWQQLMRLRPAFEGHSVTYMTTLEGLADQFQAQPCIVVTDASRREPFRMVRVWGEVIGAILNVRPKLVITTGAAPGLLAIVFGKIFGARTIWIDSIANGDVMSLSGKLARPFADVWLTQWPELAGEGGPEYWGAVL